MSRAKPAPLPTPLRRAPSDSAALGRAYARCHEIVAERAKNFSYAFLLLPAARRRGLEAIYAYCRVADDFADEDALPVAERALRLSDLRERLARAVPPAGQARDAGAPGADALPADPTLDPLLLALADTAERFGVRHADLDLVSIGCEQDLVVTRYETFAELYDYCYMVASAVGLACLDVFGYRGEPEEIRPLAIDLGIAMQLTNIVRDVREDMERDRVYLPQEDLRRFGVSERQLREGRADGAWRALCAFQVQRARHYFARGALLQRHVFRASRVCPLALAAIYQALLDQIERNDHDVFRARASLTSARKLGLLGVAVSRGALGV